MATTKVTGKVPVAPVAEEIVKDVPVPVADAVNTENTADENQDIFDAVQPGGDPYSKIGEKYSQEAIDAMESSIEKQVASMGQATGAALRKEQRYKVLIPIDKLNPHDGEVIVGINGFNLQIKKNIPVMLPGPIIDILEEGGYNPTLVR